MQATENCHKIETVVIGPIQVTVMEQLSVKQKGWVSMNRDIMTNEVR